MPAPTAPPPTMANSLFDSIPDSIEAFRNGEFLVVLDDPDRENEADLIIAAQHVTTDRMAWMIRYSSGYICAPIPPPAPTPSPSPSCAQDRARACRVLADPTAGPHHLRRPGHLLPLRAHPGGVRARRGHTEAALELCRLAGLEPAAAICEIVDDGQEVPGRAVREGAGMMRGEACIAFARKWGLKVCTIADLVQHVDGVEGKLTANGDSA
ncbi:3,4-dihydroxy-2-butanone 4-phosphate synthase [Ophiocordyceps camponoti-floridani]|uniref:3,4-dihydroxy-2-butanone-4-phosphate synthase n=1 Tax=Ophiocordyceps camponoti-floridani TaxID=2030778 RepID=A0A8H4QDK5_9HYPO|nr:3,4-dihydroxy-2-butanone 4-phosphate synthase [Ophiocordyceps camponoti-floridani]